MKSPLVEDISSYLTENSISGSSLKNPNQNLIQKFSLEVVGAGVTRIVYRQKYSRKVIKVGDYYANRYEYCIYKIFEGTALGKHLAKCCSISKDGSVMEQEYVRLKVPIDGWMEVYGWSEFQISLEDLLEFSKNLAITDVHPSNMRMLADGTIKIVDYSAHAPSKLFSKSFSTTKFIRENKELRSLADPKFNLFVDCENSIVAQTSSSTLKYSENEKESKNWTENHL